MHGGGFEYSSIGDGGQEDQKSRWMGWFSIGEMSLTEGVGGSPKVDTIVQLICLTTQLVTFWVEKCNLFAIVLHS